MVDEDSISKSLATTCYVVHLC